MITVHGELFRILVASEIVDGEYHMLLQQTPASLALAPLLGWKGEIKISEDEEHAWYVIPYSAELDEAITEGVDALVDLRVKRPGYGQVRMAL